MPLGHSIENQSKRVQKDPKKLRDPVWISRVLSAVANNASDRNDIGILTGNWTGDYSGGVSPTTWNGSGGSSKRLFEKAFSYPVEWR